MCLPLEIQNHRVAIARDCFADIAIYCSLVITSSNSCVLLQSTTLSRISSSSHLLFCVELIGIGFGWSFQLGIFVGSRRLILLQSKNRKKHDEMHVSSSPIAENLFYEHFAMLVK